VELRQDIRRGATGPIVFLMAVLAVFALALTGWYVFASRPSTYPAAVTSSGFPGPDALDRNQQIQQSHQQDPEATHGK
jgi:hypothetical protein